MAQRRALLAAGCEKVFAEQVSSVGEREQLKAANDYFRDRDVLVATKLDRVAQSIGAARLTTVRARFRSAGGARLPSGRGLAQSPPIRGTKVFATPRISAAPKMVSLALTTFGTSGSGLHLPFLSSAKLATLLLCMA